MTQAVEPRSMPPFEIALADLLDRLLAAGVVVSGDVVLSIADVDLVYISVRALITSVRETDGSTGLERTARQEASHGGNDRRRHADQP